MKNLLRRGGFVCALFLCFAFSTPCFADDIVVYNLANIPIQYYTSCALKHVVWSGGSTSDYFSGSYCDEFIIDSFPFSVSIPCVDDFAEYDANPLFYFPLSYDGSDFPAGTRFSVLFMFPDVASLHFVPFSYTFYAWSALEECLFTYSFADDSCTFGVSSPSISYPGRFLFDVSTFVSSVLRDADGNAIGFYLSGDLVRSFWGANLQLSFERAEDFLDPTFTETFTFTFNSASDFIISSGNVLADSSSDSSGESSSTDPTMTILSTQVFDTSGSCVVYLDGFDPGDGDYSLQTFVFAGDVDSALAGNSEVIHSSTSDVISSFPEAFHYSFNGLLPETQYTCLFVLLKDGELEGANAYSTFTTQASSTAGDDSGDSSGSSGDSGVVDSADLTQVLTTLEAIQANQQTQTSILQQIKDFLTGQTDKNSGYTSELEESTGVSKDSIKDKKTQAGDIQSQAEGYGVTEDSTAGISTLVSMFGSVPLVSSVFAILIGFGVVMLLIKKGLN